MATTTYREDNFRGGNDPIITKMAVDYRNEAFVGSNIMPDVEVAEKTGKYPIFGKEHLKLHDDSLAIRADLKQMNTEDWTWNDYTVEKRGLEISYAKEEKESAAKVTDLEKLWTERVADATLLNKEKLKVDMIKNASNYDASHVESLTSTDKFSDLTNSDPAAVLADAFQTIYEDVRDAQYLVTISPDVWRKIVNNVKLLEKIKYSQKAVLTLDLFEALISPSEAKVKCQIGSGFYINETTGANVELWSDIVHVAYVPSVVPGQKRSMMTPEFGKTFKLKNYPKGLKATDKWGGELRTDIGIVRFYKSYITNANGGFLINGCL